MEQRDLLKDQIEQLGKVLAKILSDFFGLKSKVNIAQTIEISNKHLKSELDIDIEKLVAYDKNKLREYLNTRKFTEIHLETLSDYLTEVGKNKTTRADAELYLKKAVDLLEYADEISKTISFERINKKDNIEKML